jgi:hypothetical protein
MVYVILIYNKYIAYNSNCFVVYKEYHEPTGTGTRPDVAFPVVVCGLLSSRDKPVNTADPILKLVVLIDTVLALNIILLLLTIIDDVFIAATDDEYKADIVYCEGVILYPIPIKLVAFTAPLNNEAVPLLFTICNIFALLEFVLIVIALVLLLDKSILIPLGIFNEVVFKFVIVPFDAYRLENEPELELRVDTVPVVAYRFVVNKLLADALVVYRLVIVPEVAYNDIALAFCEFKFVIVPFKAYRLDEE